MSTPRSCFPGWAPLEAEDKNPSFRVAVVIVKASPEK
jgi:hypothetical protein